MNKLKWYKISARIVLTDTDGSEDIIKRIRKANYVLGRREYLEEQNGGH